MYQYVYEHKHRVYLTGTMYYRKIILKTVMKSVNCNVHQSNIQQKESVAHSSFFREQNSQAEGHIA